jgi:hypothetical protein
MTAPCHSGQSGASAVSMFTSTLMRNDTVRGFRQRRYHHAAACWRTRYGDGSHFGADRISGCPREHSFRPGGRRRAVKLRPGLAAHAGWRCTRSRRSATFEASSCSMPRTRGGIPLRGTRGPRGRVESATGSVPEAHSGSGCDRRAPARGAAGVRRSNATLAPVKSKRYWVCHGGQGPSGTTCACTSGAIGRVDSNAGE